MESQHRQHQADDDANPAEYHDPVPVFEGGGPLCDGAVLEQGFFLRFFRSLLFGSGLFAGCLFGGRLFSGFFRAGLLFAVTLF